MPWPFLRIALLLLHLDNGKLVSWSARRLDTSWWRHGALLLECYWSAAVLDAWTHPGGAMVNLDNGKLVSWSGGRLNT